MAKFYPEDVRNDCLYRCEVSLGDEPDHWTGYRVTVSSPDRGRVRVVPLDPDADPVEIRLKLRTERMEPSGVTHVRYRDAEGHIYYLPETTGELIAWSNQCDRDNKVAEAVREIILARRLFELGDRLAFDEIRPGVFKMRGFDVYSCTWDHKSKVAEMVRERDGEFKRCGAVTLDDVRDWIAVNPDDAPAFFTISRPF